MEEAITRYLSVKRDLSHDQKRLKEAEATIQRLKAIIPEQKKFYTASKNAAFEACSYPLKGSEKNYLYDHRKKSPAECLEKYFTTVVEPIVKEDEDANDEFIEYFIDTHFRCYCSLQSKDKAVNSKHRCNIMEVKRNGYIMTHMYTIDVGTSAENLSNIRIILSKDTYANIRTVYLLPVIPTKEHSNCVVNFHEKNKFQPWNVPIVWDALITQHAKDLAARRIQRAWKNKHT